MCLLNINFVVGVDCEKNILRIEYIVGSNRNGEIFYLIVRQFCTANN